MNMEFGVFATDVAAGRLALSESRVEATRDQSGMRRKIFPIREDCFVKSKPTFQGQLASGSAVINCVYPQTSTPGKFDLRGKFQVNPC